jgi:hypothetical protein
MGQKEAAAGKGIFHLIAVTDGLFGAEDGADGRQGYFPYPPEVIFYLLLLIFQLPGVGQHLPSATPADAEMRAKWLHAFRGVLSKSGDMSFGPVLLNPGKADIDHISRHCVLDEDHLPIHPGQGLAFRGIILYQDTRQCNVLIFFSHGVKV